MEKGGQKKGGKQRRNERGIAILARNVRKYRTEKGLTISQLALNLEVDYSQVSRIERGVVNATISMIFEIANELKIPPHQLIEELESDSKIKA